LPQSIEITGGYPSRCNDLSGTKEDKRPGGLQRGYLCDLLECVDKISPGKRYGKRLTILAIDFDNLFYDLTELIKDNSIIGAMTAAIKELRATSNETAVLIRPFHYLHVFRSPFHGSSTHGVVALAT